MTELKVNALSERSIYQLNDYRASARPRKEKQPAMAHEEKRRIADPALRREMARLVRQTGAKAHTAVEHLERALERM